MLYGSVGRHGVCGRLVEHFGDGFSGIGGVAGWGGVSGRLVLGHFGDDWIGVNGPLV